MIQIPKMEHSVLSASSAHRWMNCPGSLVDNDGNVIEDSATSDHAEDGKLCHAVAQGCLEMAQDPNVCVGMKGDNGRVFTQDMADNVREYVEAVRGLAPNVHKQASHVLESRVELDGVAGGVGGTVDAHFWYARTGELCVMDYKSGSVPQNPQNNEQLMIYALGLIQRYGQRPSSVTLHIVQPKADGHVHWKVPAKALRDFWAKLREAAGRAQRVLDGNGMVYHDEGPWCRWCPKLAMCPLKTGNALAVVDEVKPPAEMTDDQLRKVLDVAKDLRAFLKAAEEHARKTLEAGGHVPGYELAPGRRKKVWAVSEDRVRDYLKERSVSLPVVTPAAALKAVKDMPRGFWEWEESGSPRLRKIESEFGKEGMV